MGQIEDIILNTLKNFQNIIKVVLPIYTKYFFFKFSIRIFQTFTFFFVN